MRCRYINYTLSIFGHRSMREVSLASLMENGDLARYAIGANGDVATTAMGLSAGVAKKASDNYASTASQLLGFTDNSIARMGDAYRSAAAGESAQLTDTIGKTMKYALIAGAAVGVVYFISKSRKAA